MTCADLMEADCIHGKVWYECEQCEAAIAELMEAERRAAEDD